MTSESTNPPLEAVPMSSSAQGRDDPGAGANPPLDGSHTDPAASADFRNPPLEGSAETTSPSSALDNPNLDQAQIERWFDTQLEQAAATTTQAPKAGAKRSTSRTGAKKRTTKKGAATKRAAGSTAEKRSATTRSTRKKSARSS